MSAADVEEGTKVCTKCKEEKPRSEFYKRAELRDGLKSQCKECVSFATKKRALANKLKNASGVDVTGVKACSACKEKKPKSEFNKCASTHDGLKFRCKECDGSATKKRALANKLKNASGVDVTGVKVCSTCKVEKPKSEFNKNASARDGLKSQCKECTTSADKKRVLVNKLKNVRGVDTTGIKVCSVCKEKKPKSAFYKNMSSRDGLYSRCKECDSRDMRTRRERIRLANEETRAWLENTQVSEKRCPTCGEIKSSDGFYSKISTPSGLSTYCKECERQKSKLKYARQSALSSALATKTWSRWSSEDDRFVIENHDKMTTYQMSVKLGRTYDSVHARISTLRRGGKLV